MDFKSQGRSNYFKVQDLDIFKNYCTENGLRFIEKDQLCGFICEEGLPTGTREIGECNEQTEELDWVTEEINVLADIAEMLEDGHTMCYQESGSEGNRYVSGWAEALDNTGKRAILNLEDIYELAKRMGLPEAQTTCSY